MDLDSIMAGVSFLSGSFSAALILNDNLDMIFSGETLTGKELLYMGYSALMTGYCCANGYLGFHYLAENFLW